MNVKDFDYELPEELIAQTPLENRSSSRLLVLDKSTGDIKHCHFTDIKKYLNPGDCLVLNDTRVIPARLLGKRPGSESECEFILLKKLSGEETPADNYDSCCLYEVIVRPGRKLREGVCVMFTNELRADILSVESDGNRIVKLSFNGVLEAVLSRVGITPLPPYIKKKLTDPERYQTVYSRENGSAAAPTAGLHFTKELLAEIEAAGVSLAYVTLHVGLGTFRPVKVDKVEDHIMHSETYSITKEACDKINRAKSCGGKIICVGTTSCRVLESLERVEPTSGSTSIFIYPGYVFKHTDALITNFHLPQSTLVMLVSSLAGKEHILNAYKEAIKERYRFFSFGDAMFIH